MREVGSISAKCLLRESVRRTTFSSPTLPILSITVLICSSLLYPQPKSQRWSLRVSATVVLLAVLVIAGYRIQPPWWDTPADIEEMSDAISEGMGYEGTDEYVPAGADPSELNKDQPQIADSSGRPMRTDDADWRPAEKQFVVRADRPALLILRLFNYPAWEVMVNGRRVEAQTTEVTGQMEIPVATGRNDVRIHFARTVDRTIGGVVSFFSLGLMLALWIKTRAKSGVGEAT